MCIRATTTARNGSEVPLTFIGDGKYHNYTIVWHSGNDIKGSSSGDWSRLKDGYVDFYIDGFYLGTNNAFVPTRGSRFFLAHWYPVNKNHLWNGPLLVLLVCECRHLPVQLYLLLILKLIVVLHDRPR